MLTISDATFVSYYCKYVICSFPAIFFSSSKSSLSFFHYSFCLLWFVSLTNALMFLFPFFFALELHFAYRFSSFLEFINFDVTFVSYFLL